MHHHQLNLKCVKCVLRTAGLSPSYNGALCTSDRIVGDATGTIINRQQAANLLVGSSATSSKCTILGKQLVAAALNRRYLTAVPDTWRSKGYQSLGGWIPNGYSGSASAARISPAATNYYFAIDEVIGNAVAWWRSVGCTYTSNGYALATNSALGNAWGVTGGTYTLTVGFECETNVGALPCPA